MLIHTHTHTSLYACQAATSQASQPGSFTSARRVAQAQVKDPGLRGWPSRSQEAQQGGGGVASLCDNISVAIRPYRLFSFNQ